MAKKYEELTFNDDFMFCKILEQKPALCRELLELVLDRKVGELVGVNPQKPIEITANGKGVRFDVYAEGERQYNLRHRDAERQYRFYRQEEPLFSGNDRPESYEPRCALQRTEQKLCDLHLPVQSF